LVPFRIRDVIIIHTMRFSKPQNHTLRVEPDNYSLIIAGTVCDYNDQPYRDDKAFCRAVIDDLIRETDTKT